MAAAIIGDAQPAPLIEREEFHQLRHLPTEQRLPAGMRLVGQMYSDRTTGVWSAMLEAAASDEEVAAWCTEHEKRRRETLREFFEIVLDRTVEEPLLDVLWILTSPGTYTKLATLLSRFSSHSLTVIV